MGRVRFRIKELKLKDEDKPPDKCDLLDNTEADRENEGGDHKSQFRGGEGQE